MKTKGILIAALLLAAVILAACMSIPAEFPAPVRCEEITIPA